MAEPKSKSSNGERFGRYRLVRKIAVGGMAEIFLARQTGHRRFDKEVVVKRILPQYADHKDFVTMFLDEAALAAQLNHPNIVQIFDAGHEGQNYYLAMEYICGCDLQQMFRRNRKAERKVPLGLAVRIICDACAGLHYAHEAVGADGEPQELVHRDVSPQNVMISYEGAVKIADFGIAKAQSQIYKTRSGVLKGKDSDMSPEQAMGKELDRRSDIFSLGILLYELATGERLYQESSELMTLKSIVEGKVVAPRELDKDFSPELEEIILRALEKDPNDRYPTARALQADLELFLVEEGLAGNHLVLAEHMEEVFQGKRPEPGEVQEGDGSVSSGLPNSDWSISSISGESSSMRDKVAALDGIRQGSADDLVAKEAERSATAAPRAAAKSAPAPAPADPRPASSAKLGIVVAVLVTLVVGLLFLVVLLLAAGSDDGSETLRHREMLPVAEIPPPAPAAVPAPVPAAALSPDPAAAPAPEATPPPTEAGAP